MADYAAVAANPPYEVNRAVRSHGIRDRQALSDQRCGHREHLAHAGSTGRAFEADHHDIDGDDATRLHRRECGFLRIERACRAFEAFAAVACELDDAAFRREIAMQDRSLCTVGTDR